MIGAGWSNVFRRLSLAYGWSPATIARLTLAQVSAYLALPVDTGPRMMGPAEARAFRERKRAEREAWIDEQLRSHDRDATSRE